MSTKGPGAAPSRDRCAELFLRRKTGELEFKNPQDEEDFIACLSRLIWAYLSRYDGRLTFQDKEDIFQEAFFAAYQTPPTRGFTSLVHKIVRNKVVDHFRKSGWGHWEPTEPDVGMVDEPADAENICGIARDAIEQLLKENSYLFLVLILELHRGDCREYLKMYLQERANPHAVAGLTGTLEQFLNKSTLCVLNERARTVFNRPRVGWGKGGRVNCWIAECVQILTGQARTTAAIDKARGRAREELVKNFTRLYISRFRGVEISEEDLNALVANLKKGGGKDQEARPGKKQASLDHAVQLIWQAAHPEMSED